MSLNQKIRKLDVFKKVPQDLSEGTNIGGAISIITAILIIFFTCHEVYDFINPKTNSRISYDTPFTRSQMTIFLDVEFPGFPCQIISLDLQDVMMSHHPNIGSVKKYRLDSNGKRLQNTDFELLRQPNQQKQFDMAKQAFKRKLGCRLIGSFTVKQVPGNFHISSHAYQNIYVRLAMDGVIQTLDVSHKINQLYLGQITNIQKIQKQHPDAQLMALNGHQRTYDMTSTPHSYTSHYHIDIVPTLYGDYIMRNVQAYQYTYNHNTYEVGHMPSLYFNYHIGGLKVMIMPQAYRFTAFLLQMFAIIGGLYTIASFLDHMIHQYTGSKHQYELIK